MKCLAITQKSFFAFTDIIDIKSNPLTAQAFANFGRVGNLFERVFENDFFSPISLLKCAW